MSVTPFPLFNLTNVPEALRKLANDIEADPALGVRAVIALETGDGGSSYRAFGPDFCRAHAVGLMAYAQAQIIGSIE